MAGGGPRGRPPEPLAVRLLQAAAEARCGIVPPAREVPTEPCDMPGIVNVAVPPERGHPWQGVSGAVAWGDRRQARQAAVAEALERYAAAQMQAPWCRRDELPPGEAVDEDFALYSPAQRSTPGFEWPLTVGADDGFVPVYRLSDNRRVWVPQELVGLGPRRGTARLPSTSSGLAAQPDGPNAPWGAVLRALQEVLERDALAVTWLNGLGGRVLTLPDRHDRMAQTLGAQVLAFDLTQVWNPHPVVAVMGSLPAEGRPRQAFGIACRADLEEAVDKAWLEWAQSLRYADFMQRREDVQVPADPQALRRFDEHAAYYTVHPAGWAQLPLWRHQTPWTPPPRPAAPRDPLPQLDALRLALGEAGLRLYYREITPADVAEAGLRVARVLAPQLSPLHADERAPFLGGRCQDIAWRYPGARRHGPWPNPWPHPLG